MLDANYVKHLKVLGKLCYAWDQAIAEEGTDTTAIAARKSQDAALYDQVATGGASSLDATDLIIAYGANLKATRGSVDNSRSTLLVQVTAAYLTNTLFYGDLVSNTPTTPSDAKSVLEALLAEMGTDSKTFTTQAGTGLVNFFETVWSPTGSFPQAGSPTYADSTYVVLAVV